MNTETSKEEARTAHQPTINGVSESVQIASKDIIYQNIAARADLPVILAYSSLMLSQSNMTLTDSPNLKIRLIPFL